MITPLTTICFPTSVHLFNSSSATVWLLEGVKRHTAARQPTDLRRGRGGERKDHSPVKYSLNLQQKDEAEASRESPLQCPTHPFHFFHIWAYREYRVRRHLCWQTPYYIFFILTFSRQVKLSFVLLTVNFKSGHNGQLQCNKSNWELTDGWAE